MACHRPGFSNRSMAGQLGVHHSVIDRLVQCLQATEMVDERPRSDRPRKCTHREDMLIARGARRNRFDTSVRIRDELNFGGCVSVRTVNSKQCLRAWRPIKRSQLLLHHRWTQWNWSRYNLG